MLVKKVKLKSLLCHITGQMGLKWIRQTYLVLWTLNALRIIMVSFHKVCLDSIQCDLVVFTKPFCNQYYLVCNKFTAALAVRNFALMKTSLMQMMKIVLSVASVSYAIIGKVQLKIVIWSIFFFMLLDTDDHFMILQSYLNYFPVFMTLWSICLEITKYAQSY